MQVRVWPKRDRAGGHLEAAQQMHGPRVEAICEDVEIADSAPRHATHQYPGTVVLAEALSVPVRDCLVEAGECHDLAAWMDQAGSLSDELRIRDRASKNGNLAVWPIDVCQHVAVLALL